MTAPYKKRLKGNWTQGKAYKGDGEERRYSKVEIEQELAADEEAYLDRYHKGKRTKNMLARLTYRVRWYEDALARRKGRSDSFSNYLRDALKKVTKALEEL